MPPVPVLQLLLTALACFGLWRLCRAQPAIVIAGFLIRAFVAQALFWISYLKLPVGRSLQLGNGFWFFGLDGQYYLGFAVKVVGRGLAAIPFVGDEFPSRFFVQVLSLFVAAFGGVASVAILLNCLAYLLTCAIVIRLRRDDVVLAAIAFSPASILFSLQPLKDTLFMLLIVALFAAFRRWEELWRAGGTRAQLLVLAAAMLAAVYALAGIRWYFAAIVAGCSAILCAWVTLSARRKGLALAVSAVLFVLLAQSVRLGALDLPPAYDRLLNPMTVVRWRPAAAQEHIAAVRSGFESTPGATTIAPGAAIAPPPPATSTTATPATKTAAAKPVATKTEAPKPVASKPAASKTATTKTASTKTASTKTTVVKPPPATTTTAAATPAPAPTQTQTAPPPTPPAIPSPPAATTAVQPAAQSILSRVTTGFAAMFLPRVVAESLGIIHVGGGRGLWLFAEADTIVFDLVLLYAIVHCVRSLRRGRARMTATFILCVLALVMTAGPMLYTVNNFGTLFRLRLMVYFLAALLPITLRSETDAVQ